MKVVFVLLALVLAFALGRFTVPSSPEPNEATDAAVVVQDRGLLGERVKRANSEPFESELAEDLLPATKKEVSLEQLVAEKDPIKRAGMFADLLASLDAENAREAFAALLGDERRRRSDSEMHELKLVLHAWGKLNGKLAMEEASALLAENPVKDGGKREKLGKKDKMDGGLLGAALEGWASHDLRGAAAYVEAIEEKGDQVAFRSHLVESLLLKGPDEAMAYIQSLPQDDRSRSRYVSMVTNDVLDKGIDQAIAWMESLPEELRRGASSEIASAFARQDLDGAIAWASEGFGDDAQANKALAKVTGRWANMDPRAASEYLAGLPASSGKDAAVEGFATRLAGEDPASAAAWSTTIQDERLRGRTMARIAHSWARSDEDAARAWVLKQGLPESALTKGKRKPGKVKKAEKRR